MAAQMQRVLTMPNATVAANLAGQPEEVREQVYRLIDAAVDGQFELHAGS
jgi:hypothetical protein